jgi:hypothetical protein
MPLEYFQRLSRLDDLDAVAKAINTSMVSDALLDIEELEEIKKLLLRDNIDTRKLEELCQQHNMQ